MNIFLIGSSSEFASNIALEFVKKNNNVYKFGRANLSYLDYNAMKEELSEYPDPDIVIFNTHCPGHYVDISKQISVEQFLDISQEFNKVFYNKLYLYDICKQADHFVFITSSITQWHEDIGFEKLMYRQFRASEQQIMKCIAVDGKLSYGLCPGGMDDDPEAYATKLAQIILKQDKKLNGRIHLVGEVLHWDE